MKITREIELFSNRPEFNTILNWFANMSDQSLDCVETMINRFEKFMKKIRLCEDFQEDHIKTGISLKISDKPTNHLKLQYSAPRKDYNLTIFQLTEQNLNELLDNKTEQRKSINLANLYETFSAWGKEYRYELNLISSHEGTHLSLNVTEMNCETFLTESPEIVNRRISKSDLDALVKLSSGNGINI